MQDFNLDEEKNDLLGELDHLNSFIGLAKSFVKNSKIKRLLTNIQNDLFVIQANIARPRNAACLPKDITQNRVLDIQKEVFFIEKGLKKINHFIIPEGNTAACMMHCVRTIARNVERRIKGYLHEPTIMSQYFDQVACLLFALSRHINKQHNVVERVPAYVKSLCSKNQPLRKRRLP